MKGVSSDFEQRDDLEEGPVCTLPKAKAWNFQENENPTMSMKYLLKKCDPITC
jgi:hypothetical protein